MNKDYLTAAGSVLTVESRHNAYLRAALGESPIPQPFDAPLSFDEVFTLAAVFITECPSTNPTLPIKAFPSLMVKGMTPIMTESTITLETPGHNFAVGNGEGLFACFIAVTGPTCVSAVVNGDGTYTITVPSGFRGQSYAVLNSCSDSVTDDTVVAGPAIIEIE
jgi:hypothetical protein